MNFSSLKITSCKHCGHSLERHQVMDADGEHLRYGMVQCRCGLYPVIEGILFYRPGGYGEDELARFDLAEPLQALTRQLSQDLKQRAAEPEKRFLKRQIRRMTTKENFRDLAHEYIDSDRKPLFDMIRHWGDKHWEDYLKFRPSSPTYTVFLNLLNHLHLNKSGPSFILDLCSGLSHFSFLLTQFFPASRVVCADISFLNLYFGSKYMAPNAEYILLDVNRSLPFKDHAFSLCLHVDSFHYIQHKQKLSQEMKRITNRDGILFLAHLHSAYGSHSAPGSPLDTSAYLDLFGRENTRVFNEEILYQTVMSGRDINLNSMTPHRPVEKIREITMMVGPEKTAEKAKKSRRNAIPRGGRLSLNPLYALKKMDDAFSLSLKFPSKYFRNEYGILVDFLPGQFKISRKEWQRIADCFTRDCRLDEIEEFMRKGILVASPDAYFHPSWPSMKIPPGIP